MPLLELRLRLSWLPGLLFQSVVTQCIDSVFFCMYHRIIADIVIVAVVNANTASQCAQHFTPMHSFIQLAGLISGVEGINQSHKRQS